MATTYNQWEQEYKPIDNPIADVSTKAFETYGAELDVILGHPDNHVWTEIDGDNGCYIVSGYHLVDRIQYYVTEKPWTEDTSITVCTYDPCDCTKQTKTNSPEQECEICSGTGTTTRWEN